jgi:hypothetical protein
MLDLSPGRNQIPLGHVVAYTATTSGMVFSPAGLCTMIEVPFVGYMLTRGYDPRKMVFFGLVVLASSFWWLSSLNLEIAERDINLLPQMIFHGFAPSIRDGVLRASEKSTQQKPPFQRRNTYLTNE